MTSLAVIGNISRDTACYPTERRRLLGGAALHVALAATRAGASAAPVSVIGRDLVKPLRQPGLAALDLSDVAVSDRPSCSFELSYDRAGRLISVNASYGAALQLTDHALRVLHRYPRVHVCCRRPLDPARTVAALVELGIPFSIDLISSSASQVVPAIADVLPHAQMVFVNAAEFVTLAAVIPPARLPAVAVTNGPHRVALHRYGKLHVEVDPPRATAIEVTGAGDTVTGTFLAATLRGADDTAALREAVAAATTGVATTGVPLEPRLPEV